MYPFIWSRGERAEGVRWASTVGARSKSTLVKHLSFFFLSLLFSSVPSSRQNWETRTETSETNQRKHPPDSVENIAPRTKWQAGYNGTLEPLSLVHHNYKVEIAGLQSLPSVTRPPAGISFTQANRGNRLEIYCAIYRTCSAIIILSTRITRAYAFVLRNSSVDGTRGN